MSISSSLLAFMTSIRCWSARAAASIAPCRICSPSGICTCVVSNPLAVVPSPAPA
jgi:hypothetical protein